MQYEILPALPSAGPMYVPVADNNELFFAEGFVVRFYPKDGTSWVGNFKPGGRALNTVISLAGTSHVLVIAGGAAYIMDPEQTKPISVFGYGYTAVIQLEDGRLILQETTGITVVETNGTHWMSDDISMDEIREVKVKGNTVMGMSLEVKSDGSEEWVPFYYNIDTKELSGVAGRYYDFIKKEWNNW